MERCSPLWQASSSLPYTPSCSEPSRVLLVLWSQVWVHRTHGKRSVLFVE